MSRPWKVIVQKVHDDTGNGRQHVRVRGLGTVEVPVDAEVWGVADRVVPVLADLHGRIYEVHVTYSDVMVDGTTVPRGVEICVGDGHTIESEHGVHEMSLKDALHEWGRALRGEELQW